MPSPTNLQDTILAAWKTNNRVTVFLIEHLPAELWEAAVPGAPRRTVRMIAGHIHNARCMWIKTLGKEHGIAVPRSIRWLFSMVTTVTLPIGFVVSELMLIVLYFGVITPLAFALRVLGRDPLDRSIDREAATHWVQHRDVGDASRYFRQS